jgi:hypothetical protein
LREEESNARTPAVSSGGGAHLFSLYLYGHRQGGASDNQRDDCQSLDNSDMAVVCPLLVIPSPAKKGGGSGGKRKVERTWRHGILYEEGAIAAATSGDIMLTRERRVRACHCSSGGCGRCRHNRDSVSLLHFRHSLSGPKVRAPEKAAVKLPTGSGRWLRRKACRYSPLAGLITVRVALGVGVTSERRGGNALYCRSAALPAVGGVRLALW